MTLTNLDIFDVITRAIFDELTEKERFSYLSQTSSRTILQKFKASIVNDYDPNWRYGELIKTIRKNLDTLEGSDYFDQMSDRDLEYWINSKGEL